MKVLVATGIAVVVSVLCHGTGYAGGGGGSASRCSTGKVGHTNRGCFTAFVAHACTGAKNINAPASDAINKQHGNMIDAEFEMSVRSAGAQQIIGWEYQTYGGQEYFQFAQSPAVNIGPLRMSFRFGPMAPFKGSVYDTVLVIAKSFGMTQQQLPPPLDAMTSRTPVFRRRC